MLQQIKIIYPNKYTFINYISHMHLVIELILSNRSFFPQMLQHELRGHQAGDEIHRRETRTGAW